jgi:hypothetical protein
MVRASTSPSSRHMPSASNFAFSREAACAPSFCRNARSRYGTAIFPAPVPASNMPTACMGQPAPATASTRNGCWSTPYARELGGRFSYDPSPAQDPVHALSAAVVDEAFDWGGDAPPATAWHRQCALRSACQGNASRLHPGVPEVLRGTYAGLASPAMLAHFRKLGITAVKLCCRYTHFLDEERLVHEAVCVNYWGYNTLVLLCSRSRAMHRARKRRPGA